MADDLRGEAVAVVRVGWSEPGFDQALDHHVSRHARLGPSVLISENWYKPSAMMFAPALAAVPGQPSTGTLCAI